MEILNDWFQSLIARSYAEVKDTVQATGVCKKHTGGMVLYASVNLSVGPGKGIEYCDLLNEAVRTKMTSEGWYRQILYGVLDVFLTHSATPISSFILTIEGVDYHEIDSNELAFRLAGRDAARKCLNVMNFVIV